MSYSLRAGEQREERGEMFPAANDAYSATKAGSGPGSKAFERKSGAFATENEAFAAKNALFRTAGEPFPAANGVFLPKDGANSAANGPFFTEPGTITLARSST